MTSIPSFNFDPVNFETTTAAKSYSAQGELIASGGAKHRLCLGGKSDTRFNIAVTQLSLAENSGATGFFKKLYLGMTHVKLKEGGNTIYLNINSLATRLHFSKDQIKQAASTGNLKSLIKEKMQNQAEIINYYEDIFSSYNNDAKTLKTETRISKRILMKVVQSSVPLLDNSNSNTVQFQKKGVTFIAQKTAENTLKLTRLGLKPFAKGGFGEVSKAWTLRNSKRDVTEVQAFKAARDYYDNPELEIMERREKAIKARKELEDEVEMQDYLHDDPQGAPKTIQDKYHTFIQLSSPSGESVTGYLIPLMDSDLRGVTLKAIPETIPQLLTRGRDILDGVRYLHSKNVVHKDIKPANFLVKGDRTAVSDLGGAKRIDGEHFKENFTTTDPNTMEEKFKFGTHTRRYTSQEISNRARGHFEKGEIEDCKKALLRNDVFSTAATLYGLFTEELPYSLKINGYPNSNFNFNRLHERGLPIAIINLLEDMSDIDKEMTMDEAYKRYTEAMP